jgi:hypothetical protein
MTTRVEAARLVRKICPYEDGSGFRYTVTVSRVRETVESKGQDDVVIEIENGSHNVEIGADDWSRLRNVIDAAFTHVCECTE